MDSTTILTIQDLTRGGAGLARDSGGRVIFVPWTAPGDQVRVSIDRQEKNYAHGTLLEILEPSPIRQAPRCPAFGTCGGCQWQHIPYELQWKTKVQGVLQALRRVQVTPPGKIEEFPAEQIWEYRNRIQLKGSGRQLGFFKPGTHTLVPVERCDLARPEINEGWEQIRTEGVRFSQPYQVEVEVLPSGELSQSWNEGHAARGFRQVHDEQNQKLQSWIAIVLPRFEVLYDLFGGAGNLSLPLAKHGAQVHCVDLSVPLSPEALPAGFLFHRSAVLPWLLRQAQVVAQGVRPDPAIAILDPPREGLGRDFLKIAHSLESLHVKAVLAVGCDPDSWSRDLCAWVKRGWKFERMMVIDFFPQTSHLESVAYLTWEDKI
jgi:tRNA/tmRNA/rRNA uracil-C5-methylase (TrmA/RlmC/RlmD family)